MKKNRTIKNAKLPSGLGVLIDPVFKKKFLVLSAILEFLKQNYVLDQFGAPENYRNNSLEKLNGQVSIISMRFESSVKIDKVARNAMETGKFIVTIHDGILVRPDDACYFQELILDLFESLVGIKPKVPINTAFQCRHQWI